MPEPRRDRFHVVVRADQKRCVRMAQAVGREALIADLAGSHVAVFVDVPRLRLVGAETVFDAKVAEHAVKVGRVRVRAEGVGHHGRVVVLDEPHARIHRLRLHGLPSCEEGHGRRVEADPAAGIGAFGRSKLAVVAELLADEHRVGIEIDVRPIEAQHFALSQSAEEHEPYRHGKGRRALAIEQSRKAFRLLGAERFGGFTLGLGDLYLRCGVAVEYAVVDGLFEYHLQTLRYALEHRLAHALAAGSV